MSSLILDCIFIFFAISLQSVRLCGNLSSYLTCPLQSSRLFFAVQSLNFKWRHPWIWLTNGQKRSMKRGQLKIWAEHPVASNASQQKSKFQMKIKLNQYITQPSSDTNKYSRSLMRFEVQTSLNVMFSTEFQFGKYSFLALTFESVSFHDTHSPAVKTVFACVWWQGSPR